MTYSICLIRRDNADGEEDETEDMATGGRSDSTSGPGFDSGVGAGGAVVVESRFVKSKLAKEKAIREAAERGLQRIKKIREKEENKEKMKEKKKVDKVRM